MGNILKNNIVLVTENFRLAQKIKSRLVLLRNNDCFDIIEPENCIAEIREKKPFVIFFHLSKFNEDEFFYFLQKIKQSEDLKNISIVLLYDFFNEDILCSAFELGITDFISTKATETELTVRTIWALQKQEKNIELQNRTNLLKELKIIDKQNDAFTESYTKEKIKEEMKKNKGCFVVIAPDINNRNKISPTLIMKIIKNSIRNSDTIGFASDFKIYLWLKNSKKEDVLNVLKKIQNNLSLDFSISAGFIEVKNKDFSVIEELTNEALSKALLKGHSFVCAEENNIKQNINIQSKNLTSFENLLSPLFYQYQKRNEEKLFETKISQFVNKEKSSFKLENQNGQSSFILTNDINKKTEIEVLHNIIGMEIKAEKISFDKNKIKIEQIESFLDSFIKDFQKYTNC